MTGPDAEARVLEVPGAAIAYDVRGVLPTADGRPPLLMVGQPMDASGFATLAAHFPDRTVVTYDPRGLGRSTRSDGRTDNDPVTHADDLHRLIAEVGGPVDVFASSGGAIDMLALVATHPDDVALLVAHEPPLITLLPDGDAIERANAEIRRTYADHGWGAGLARFITLTSWQGEIAEDYFDQPAPDPAAFGLPTEDDGSGDDPLLSGASDAITALDPDIEALIAAPTEIVVAAGEETGQAMMARAAEVLAQRLGVPLTTFPSHHAGFLGGEFGQQGQPEAFGARLREVLDG